MLTPIKNMVVGSILRNPRFKYMPTGYIICLDSNPRAYCSRILSAVLTQ